MVTDSYCEIVLDFAEGFPEQVKIRTMILISAILIALLKHPGTRIFLAKVGDPCLDVELVHLCNAVGPIW